MQQQLNNIKNKIAATAKERGLPNIYIQFRVNKNGSVISVYQLNVKLNDINANEIINKQNNDNPNFVSNKILELAKANNISEATANIRIYVEENDILEAVPKAALYNKDRFVAIVEMKELVN